jgi:hypothetical protein
MTELPLSPFITDPENRFVLNEEAFMEEVEGLPAFIASPSAEYLEAAELEPMLRMLFARVA